ncbi:hypothetical protein SDC9_117964 [bioreactor metagenome]|uniref:Acyltransferase 3 domain-containing protein n=1 Tax=bioreactor metagenome TaxID=1076179 RepID=A0A645C226_9ZZZZ
MIWNDYGQKFYVWGGENRLLSSLIILANPWFMPILFVIAGMCAKYSLEKRTTKEFIHERVQKLFVPFVSGLILLVPFQTLFARKYFDGYSGTIVENILYFFTHFTDLSGYDGAFTPGQLWFILFLFLISLVGLLIAKLMPYGKVQNLVSQSNIIAILALFPLVWAGYYIGNFGGFSLGKNLVLYLLGYYILSNEKVLEVLEKFWALLFSLFCVSLFTLVFLYYNYAYYGDGLVNFVSWVGSCALIATGMKFFNTNSKALHYLSQASFPIYILHQSVLVAVGYYVLRYLNGLFLQVVAIMGVSFLLTIGLYEIVKRIPFVKTLIGMK